MMKSKTAPDRRPGIQAVYCDEAGFTGDNLLDAAQPVFVYAAVAVDPEEADQLIERVDRETRARGAQVKAASLVGTATGRKILTEVLAPVADRTIVTVSDKRFALAGKFFEYVFEPVLAENNAFFYSIGFHKFVANLLNVALVAKDVSAEDAIAGFQRFMRTQKFADLEAFLGTEIGEEGSAWRVLSNFAIAYRQQIADELKVVDRWTLDLSTTSLMNCLSQMGQRFEQLDLYCDRSEPIRRSRKLIDAFVGNTNQVQVRMGSRTYTQGFNLANPMHLVDSRTHSGIQLADFMATSVSWAFRGPDGRLRPEVKTELRPLLGVTMCPISAETELLDLSKKEVVLNGLLLVALDRRAREGVDPLAGIAEEYHALSDYYDISPPPGIGRQPVRRVPKIGRNELCPCGSGSKYKRCHGSAA